MAEQHPGLRFDIFERVHLTEEVNGIESLEEIELLPHIELSTQGQHTILEGHLQLTGRYTNTRNEHEGASLEHRIPVNISMPSERIQNVEDLGVKIDHFDIDLLSSRLLNVTGVLYLQGVNAAETRPSTSSSSVTEQDEVYFVHEASEDQTEQSVNMRQSTDDDHEEPVSPKFPEQMISEAATQASSEISQETEQQDKQEDEQSAIIADDRPPETSVETSVEASTELLEEQPSTPAEMKIAFSGKQTAANELTSDDEQQAETVQAVDEDAVDADAAEAIEVTAEVVEEAAEETEGNNTISEQVQWKNLFLPKEESEEEQFRKVRMCIVQKEETLDSIAERYSLNPREILLYNRLGEQQEVTEGQVIYIPN